MSTARERYVFDGFAVLAYLQGEGGAGEVRSILEKAEAGQAEVAMTVINLGEVLYIVEREESLEAAQAVLATIDSLPVNQRPVTRPLALHAAHFKARHRMSYADCFAAALAVELQARVVTGDPEFRSIENEVPVVWLPNGGFQS